jgi:hypothetical protein
LLRVEGKQKGALKGKLFILEVRQLPFDINPEKSYHKVCMQVNETREIILETN